MPYVDLAFPIRGSEIPVDHGYSLYSAISKIIPDIHESNEIGIHPIRGMYSGNKTFVLAKNSFVSIRLEAKNISHFLSLAGKSLEIDGYMLLLGVPRIFVLRSSPILSARLVTIKGFMDKENFTQALLRQMNSLEIQGKAEILRQRYLTVQDKKVVGFQVRLHELSAEESLLVQEKGLGGKRKMGCGLFVPVRKQE